MNLMAGLSGLAGFGSSFADSSDRAAKLDILRQQLEMQKAAQAQAIAQDQVDRRSLAQTLNPSQFAESYGDMGNRPANVPQLPSVDMQLKVHELTAPQKGDWAFEDMEGPEGPGKYLVDKATGRAKRIGGIVSKGGTLIDWIDRNFPNATAEQKMEMLKQHQAAGRSSINIDNGLTKGAAGQFQTDIVDNQDLLNALDTAETLFDPNYSTYSGAVTAGVDEISNKFGLPASDFTVKQREWKAAADQAYITYRKWATGVAGSAKEFSELMKTFPNSDDAPAIYKSKMAMTKAKIAQKIAERRSALDGGVDAVGGGKPSAPTSQPVTPSTPKVIKFDAQGNQVN